PSNTAWPPQVLSTLRRDYGFSRTPNRHYSVPCVFSTEQLRYPKPDGSICLEKKFVGDGVKLDCAGGFGAVMMVTATFGMVAATRAVDKLVAGTRRPSERIKPLAVAADQA
ncbi:tRNA threonylcarbamoyladenosine dehydratase, partial [Pseudomonas syringae]|nr:tRNA threonylcarbamoyladenosine dehydratase [Pseudomonas syringae]